MRYRLKFGDAFAAQEYQMCLSVESAGRCFGPSLQVSNMHYQLKLGAHAYYSFSQINYSNIIDTQNHNNSR